MPFILTISRCTLLLVFISGMCRAAVSDWVNEPHIQVRLISNVSQVVPGSRAILGLELKPEAGWHVYWRNPGDSGMPPTLQWQDSGTAVIGDLLWPYPHAIPYGPLTNYGYEHVVLPMQIDIPEKGLFGALPLKAKSRWLVCKEICLPGKAELAIQLPVGNSIQGSDQRELIEYFTSAVPRPLKLLEGTAITSERQLQIELFAGAPVFRNVEEIVFFPINEQLVEAAAEAELHWRNNYLTIKQNLSSDFTKLPGELEGVLVLNQKQAWQFKFNTAP